MVESIVTGCYVPGVLIISANGASVVIIDGDGAVGEDGVLRAGLLRTVLVYVAHVSQGLHQRLTGNGGNLLAAQRAAVAVGRVAVGEGLAGGDGYCAAIATGVDAVCRRGAAQGDGSGILDAGLNAGVAVGGNITAKDADFTIICCEATASISACGGSVDCTAEYGKATFSNDTTGGTLGVNATPANGDWAGISVICSNSIYAYSTASCCANDAAV